MPRVSAAHEREIRSRIVDAAARVFGRTGYHSSTIADVCHESGLSVGAVYTYFASKEDLFRTSCDQIAARGLEELAARLAGTTTTLERLRVAVELYVEAIDEYAGAPGQVSLIQAWAEVDREPGLLEMLTARRERLVGAAELLLRQGMASGEMPPWLDVDGVTRGFLALLDGLLLQRVEAGGSYRPADLVRRAMAILMPMLAAAGAPEPDVVGRGRADPGRKSRTAAPARA
ncbi:MAG: TetR/AcrR family transcriptional regulator [Chloroflexi bacterium]|nr:TetR/AcrR family transcriptional regulator [Chloroflexota bacterium]